MTTRGRWRAVAPPLGLFVGWGLLVAAWVGANPPGAAADEPEHYVRALSVGTGTLIGNPPAKVRSFPGDPERDPFLHVISRDVPVPAGLGAPASWSCFINDHTASGACLVREARSADTRQTTYQGSYPPWFYVLPGLAMRLAGDPLTALLVGRAATAVIGLAFLLAAVAALWDETAGAVSLLGLGWAVTPMVLSVVGSLSTSGAEIPAGVAACALLVRVGRGGPKPRWIPGALVTALLVIALVRPFGPFYVAFMALLALLVVGPNSLLLSLRVSRGAQAGAVLLVLAISVTLAWDQAYLGGGLPSIAQLPGVMLVGLLYVSEATREMIGVFGQTDTLMPGFAYALWGLGSVGLITVALRVGSHRQRRTLEVLVLGVFLVGVLTAVAQIPNGFGVNGRQLLPAAVAIPILAGETCYLRRDRLGGRVYARALPLAWGVVMLVQLAGWYANAHRVAVGTGGPWWFAGGSEWAPASGWMPWLVLAVAGASAAGAFLLRPWRPLPAGGTPQFADDPNYTD